MRFVDLAVDLAAVLNASRSVASKHIALRGRQLDAYSRNSSIAVPWRNAKPSCEAGPSSGSGETNPSPNTAEAATSAGIGAQDRAAPGSKTEDASAREAIHTSSGSPFSSAQRSAHGDENGPRDLDAPSDVDVGIFHTARGSKILESLKQKKAADTARTRPGGPAKENPLRYWPHAPPAETDQMPSSNDSVAEQARAAASQSPPLADAPSAAEPGAQDASPVQATPTKADEETVDIARELMGDEAASPTAYKLRESKVPASRFGRLWNYGGLAAGMLGGAITESVSRAFGGGGQGSVMLSGKNMERLVARLSRMRGAAIKLGQMMSLQDSKMLAAPIQEVLQRVQDKADYMPAWQRDRVLVSNLGDGWRGLFSEFEETPMAAASIGQVHKAVLKSNGRKVAVKIQFPGVAASIDSDLDNLGILLNATKLLPKGLYLNKTIDNARVELGWECDYEREARCARRYKELLRDEEVLLAPDVYPEASGKQVLTMDFMDGVAVTRVKSFTQEQRDWIGTHIMRLCLREVTEFRFMQTDPNWTNFFYNADLRKLELLDFGASREYPEEFVRQYVQLLEASSRGDRDGVRVLSQGLGYLTGYESKAMVDAHVDSVLTLGEPFGVTAPRVYDFKDQTITDRVGALIPVMLRERLVPPPEETYSLHRKLSGAFLLCARLGSRVACREIFAEAVYKSGYVERRA